MRPVADRLCLHIGLSLKFGMRTVVFIDFAAERPCGKRAPTDHFGSIVRIRRIKKQPFGVNS